MKKLYKVVEMIANCKFLPNKYQCHSLIGDYKDLKECHIEPDWILIYRICFKENELMLYRIGSHSNLFR